MRYVIIPDVHGRSFWKEAVKVLADHYIFLGDYMDPYPHEKISNETALENFLEILDFKHQDTNKTTLLLGNHDLGYMTTPDFCSSRHWSRKHETLNTLYNSNKNLFDIYYKAGEFILSHAGVHPEWLKQESLSIDQFLVFNKMYHSDSGFQKVMNSLYYIDYWRGGWCSVGSPVWADVRCFFKSEVPDDFPLQIFGHTQLNKNPISIKGGFCVDCRRAFLLENGVLKELDGSDIILENNN